MLGIEHKSLNLGLNGFAEIGFVFGRQFEYEHLLPDKNLPATMMARIGYRIEVGPQSRRDPRRHSCFRESSKQPQECFIRGDLPFLDRHPQNGLG